MNRTRWYIAIDLKSFYASVECVERDIDPLDSCLVVADESRTDKTICLAVTPPLKQMGIKGRPRLFEVRQRIRDINLHRGRNGRSWSLRKLISDSSIAADYIVAVPRMALYLEYSRRIIDIYLRFVSEEDLHVYSVDEVFIDATDYLMMYRMSAHQLAITIIRTVLAETGITATAGIGTNMYLCKVAMDIVAKKMNPDPVGVRIAELDEHTYRHKLWTHKPLTDFWRIGKGTANRLARYGITTMGDLARFSISNEGFLFKLFGINAELLIDHAWGYEPVRMRNVKEYVPSARSLSSGQVLGEPYRSDMAMTVAMEMADSLARKMLSKHLVTSLVTLYISYEKVDYGSRGSLRLAEATSSVRRLIETVRELFLRVTDSRLFIRRINIIYSDIREERNGKAVQLSLFEEENVIVAEKRMADRERRCENAAIAIKAKFGKNAILKGLNYGDGATQRERNCQIGGHHE